MIINTITPIYSIVGRESATLYHFVLCLIEKLSYCHQIQLRSVEKYPCSRARPLCSAAEHFAAVQDPFSALQTTLATVQDHFSALQSTLHSCKTTFQRCGVPLHTRKTTLQRCRAHLQIKTTLKCTKMLQCKFKRTPSFKIVITDQFKSEHFSLISCIFSFKKF